MGVASGRHRRSWLVLVRMRPHGNRELCTRVREERSVFLPETPTQIPTVCPLSSVCPLSVPLTHTHAPGRAHCGAAWTRLVIGADWQVSSAHVSLESTVLHDVLQQRGTGTDTDAFCCPACVCPLLHVCVSLGVCVRVCYVQSCCKQGVGWAQRKCWGSGRRPASVTSRR